MTINVIQTSDSTHSTHTHNTSHGPDAFRNVFAILHNLETSDLPFMTAEQRLAFFNDPCVAILRLDDANLDALYALVQSKQPARYREAA